MTKQWPMKHVALYAKGWYISEKGSTVWDDLKAILVLDGYTPFTKHDVFNIILGSFENTKPVRDPVRYIIHHASPTECWKVGYYTNDHTWLKNAAEHPDYVYHDAVLHAMLSSLRNLSVDQIRGDLTRPKNKMPVPKTEK